MSVVYGAALPLQLTSVCVDSIDQDTARKMLSAIREDFAGSTVLAVLHQLEHVHAFDYVAVMERGVVVEYGRPQELLSRASALRTLYDSHSAGSD